MCNRPTSSILAAISLALLISAADRPAGAQEAALPDAAEIIDRFIEATGGEEAYRKLTNRRTVGKLEFLGAGVKGEVEILQAEPNKMLTRLTLEGIGETVQGTDGTIAWSEDPINGSRLLDGKPKDDFIRMATFNSELKWRDIYEKAETVAEEEVDGVPCYKVVLTPKQGEPTVSFYDKESGLLRKSITTFESEQGPLTIEDIPGAYREFDGIKVPVSSTQSLFGQRIETTYEKVEHNVEIPEGTFEAPEALRPGPEPDGR